MTRKTTPRPFLKRAAAEGRGAVCTDELSGGVAMLSASTKKSDVRIERVSYGYEEHVFRAPLKFARAVADRATMLTATCTVRTAAGKVATGFGMLPLNYIFTF